MSTNLGLQSVLADKKDVNVWGAVHNDGHRPLQQVENIIITRDSSTAFTIKTGTQFYVWNEDNFTSPATPDTNNASYPVATSIDYYSPYAIFEDGDTTITIGVTSGFSSANGTYYVYCDQSVDTTSRGDGNYSATTNAPTYDEEKSGFYHATDGKAIARYVVAAGTFTQFMVYRGRSKDPGYISDINYTISGGAITLTKPIIDIDGKLIQYLEDVTLTTIAGGANWYAVTCNETTGALSNATLSTYVTISGNQLNMGSVYDSEKNYCVDTSERIIAVAYWTGSALAYFHPIKQRPLTSILVGAATGTSLASGSTVLQQWDTITYDLLSEFDLSTELYTQANSGSFTLTAKLFASAVAGATNLERWGFEIHKDGSAGRFKSFDERVFLTGQTRAVVMGSLTHSDIAGTTWDIRSVHTTGSTWSTHNGTADTYMSIKGVE